MVPKSFHRGLPSGIFLNQVNTTKQSASPDIIMSMKSATNLETPAEEMILEAAPPEETAGRANKKLC